MSKGWANDRERALARQLVDRLEKADGKLPDAESGMLYWELTTQGSAAEPLDAELRSLLAKYTMLGLKTQEGIPATPDGPALACRLERAGDRLNARVLSSDGQAATWVSVGTFAVDVPAAARTEGAKADAPRAPRLADAVADALLSKLVRARLSKGPRVKGKETYRVRVENGSPLILNGLALAGSPFSFKSTPSALAGLSLPPGKALTLPATADMVERLGLKNGVRVVAADLSGL